MGSGAFLTVFSVAGVKIFFLPVYGLEYALSLKIFMWVFPVMVFFPLRAMVSNYLTAHNWNWPLVISYLIANLAGFAALWFSSARYGFVISSAVYYLTVTIINLAIMLWLFCLTQQNPTPPSIPMEAGVK